MPSKTQGRFWMFTLNNPQPEEDPRRWLSEYCIWQLEKGEEGTPHYQGYIVFKSNKTPHAVKLINPRAHWELRFGTHEQAKQYCSKEETRVSGPWTTGEEPKKGKRTDLIYFKRRLQEGATEQDILEDDELYTTLQQYPKSLGVHRMLSTKHRNFKTRVLVLYGPPKKGKSHYWSVAFPGAYVKPVGEWWDGYDQQEVVILDDFYGWLKYAFLLQLLDRYPMYVEVKGGTRVFNSKIIVITSNKAPNCWYDPETCPFPAIERRLDTVYEFVEHSDNPILIKGKPISFRWNSYKDYSEEDWEFPVPEGFEQEPSPPSPRTVSEIVFNEYRDTQDGEPVLRPSYPVNPAAPKGASRYSRAYRDK